MTLPLPYYSVTEAAALLKLHPESIRRLSRAGKIHYGKVGRRYVYTIEQMKAFVELNGSAATQRKVADALEKHG